MAQARVDYGKVAAPRPFGGTQIAANRLDVFRFLMICMVLLTVVSVFHVWSRFKLVDLNQGAYQYRYTIGEKNAPVPIRICSPFLDPKLYIISAAIMKTHGYASVTLSLKNMLLGAPMKGDKNQMHRGPHGEPNDIIHFNMFHMAQEVYPDLAVIDSAGAMRSLSRNTPFDGWRLRGGVAATIVGGRIAYVNPAAPGPASLVEERLM